MALIPYKNQRPSDTDSAALNKNISAVINNSNLIEENRRLESELHLSLEEIAHLQNALADANMKLVAYQCSSNNDGAINRQEISILNEVLKEIAIPLKTITDYCDLLLLQSVGILGTFQKKFIDRINISANQISDLLEEYQNNSPTDELDTTASSHSTDIHSLIENILNTNSLLLREKQLVLQMEVPDELPRIMGENKDLHRMVEVILTNAFSITPKDGSICITACLENGLPDKKVILKIRDGGPGIPVNELRKLFPLQKYTGLSAIPGCSLTRAELAQVIELGRSQGCMIKISNAIGFGCIFEISFTALRD